MNKSLDLDIITTPFDPSISHVLPKFYLFFTQVLPIFYPCFTDILPMFYPFLPMFYPSITHVLPIFYPCFTDILPIFTHVLPMFSPRDQGRAARWTRCWGSRLQSRPEPPLALTQVNTCNGHAYGYIVVLLEDNGIRNHTTFGYISISGII